MARLRTEDLKKVTGDKVQVADLILDEKGNIQDARIGVADFSRFPKKDIYYYSCNEFTPGKYIYRTVILNLETGKAARDEVSFKIPEEQKSGIELYSPWLFVPGNKPIFMKGLSSESPTESSAKLEEIFPFINSEMEPVFDYHPHRKKRLFVLVQCRVYNPESMNLKFSLQLKEPGLEKRHSPPCRLDYKVQDEKTLLFFFDINLKDMMPGEYEMELTVKDKITGDASTASVPVHID
jgi:hypothetical protein